MKEEKKKSMILKIPAHLAEEITKFQNEEEVRTFTRPTKYAVILRALAEFFAKRITPAFFLAMLTGCAMTQAGAGWILRLILLLIVGYVVHFIAQMLRDKE